MNRQLRVLLVPDYIDWILGTWARQIAQLGKKHHYYVFPVGLIAGNRQKWETLIDYIDIVHFLTPYVADYMPEFRARNKGIVTSIHHVVDWDKLKPLTEADAIMVVAQEWKEYLLNKGVADQKVHLFKNGVDSEVFRPLANQRSLKKRFNFELDLFLLGFCGKFSSNALDRKGIQMFLKAIERLEQKEKFGIVITGPGWEKVIQELVKDNLKVYYFPFLPPHQMPMLYNALDAYIVTSNAEGGPAPLLENMACGTPVITTPVGIAKDVIRNDVNGILVSKGDSNALSEAIMRLSNLPELCNKTADSALTLIQSSLSWNKTLANIETFYVDVFDNSQSSQSIATEEVISPEYQRKWAITVDSFRWHEKLLRQGYWREGIQGISRNAAQDGGKFLFSCLENSLLKEMILRKITAPLKFLMRHRKLNQDIA